MQLINQNQGNNSQIEKELQQLYITLQAVLNPQQESIEQLLQLQVNDYQNEFSCILLDIIIFSVKAGIQCEELKNIRNDTIIPQLIDTIDNNSIKFFKNDKVTLFGGYQPFLPSYQYFNKIIQLVETLRDFYSDGNRRFVGLVGGIDQILYFSKMYKIKKSDKPKSYILLMIQKDVYCNMIIENIYNLSQSLYEAFKPEYRPDDIVLKKLFDFHEKYKLFSDLKQFQQQQEQEQAILNNKIWLTDNLNINNIECYSLQLIQQLNKTKNYDFLDQFIQYAKNVDYKNSIDYYLSQNSFIKGLLIYVTNLLKNGQLQTKDFINRLSLEAKILIMLTILKYYPNNEVLNNFLDYEQINNNSLSIIFAVVNSNQQYFDQFFGLLDQNYTIRTEDFNILKLPSYQVQFNIEKLLQNKKDSLSSTLRYMLFKKQEDMLTSLLNNNIINYYQQLNLEEQIQFFKQLLQCQVNDENQFIDIVKSIATFQKDLSQDAVQSSYVYVYLLYALQQLNTQQISEQLANLYAQISMISTTWMTKQIILAMVANNHIPQLISICENMKIHHEKYLQQIKNKNIANEKEARKEIDTTKVTEEEIKDLEQKIHDNRELYNKQLSKYQDQIADWLTIQPDSYEIIKDIQDIIIPIGLQEFSIQTIHTGLNELPEQYKAQKEQILQALKEKEIITETQYNLWL